MNFKKIFIVVIVAALVFNFFWFNLGQYMDVSDLKSRVDQQPLLTALIFFSLYILVGALNIPGAAVLTLGAGIVFGLWWGMLLVSFASSIAATVAMLIARTLLRDSVEKKFKKLVKKVNDGMEDQGLMYLFSLRLIPIIPFFAINLVFGITRIKVLNFHVISQLGMLPVSFVFINAGAQLSKVESLSVRSILTPNVIISFVLLLTLPFAIKIIMNRFQKYRLAISDAP